MSSINYLTIKILEQVKHYSVLDFLLDSFFFLLILRHHNNGNFIDEVAHTCGAEWVCAPN